MAMVVLQLVLCLPIFCFFCIVFIAGLWDIYQTQPIKKNKKRKETRDKSQITTYMVFLLVAALEWGLGLKKQNKKKRLTNIKNIFKIAQANKHTTTYSYLGFQKVKVVVVVLVLAMVVLC